MTMDRAVASSGRLLAVLAAVVCVTAAALPAAASGAEDRRIAPPASEAAIARCSAASAEGAKTADVERVVRGTSMLGGCITDVTGISHLFLEWKADASSARGRICVDPAIRANAWECAWETGELEPGSYTVTMIAVDAAGNRGSFDQAYRVEAPAPDTSPRPDPQPAPEPAPVAPQDPAPTDPAPATPAPAEPAPAPDAPTEPAPTSPDPLVTPPEGFAPVPLSRLLEERVVECSLLELAPGVRADRALSVAVLECLRPALEVAGATVIELDEIPVPPSVRVTFPDQQQLDAIDALLPDLVGGVELDLVVGPERTPEPQAQPAPAAP